MKTTYAYASIVLALMNSSNVLAASHRHRSNPTSTVSVSASVTASTTGTAYPSASVPANSTSPITAGTCNDCSGVCVTFGATDSSLTYWFNGGPGGDAASFKNKPLNSVCLTDAGAMFVGAAGAIAENGDWNGGPSTKFEWSVGASTSNFDVSVCDGFSVPMSCTGFSGNESPYTTIGGGEICSDCPAADVTGSTCKNPGAHTGVLAEVPTCFTEGEGAVGKSGTNNYWYYDNISVQSIFTGRTGVVCTVGSISSSKAKREAMGQSAVELGPRASRHRHHRRAHGHGVLAVS